MAEVASYGVIGRGNIAQEVIRQIGNVAERLETEPLPSFVLSEKVGKLVPELDATGHPQYDDKGQLKLVETGETWADVVNDDIADLVFIAMPSTDDGIQARDYISTSLEHNADVITAEKGALATYFQSLRNQSDEFANLGYNASVGGGTGMIRALQERCIDPANVQEIHIVANGTLTYIYSGIGPVGAKGRARGEVVYEAKHLGYAEPDKPGKIMTDLEVIRGEAEGDIPKKTAILFNSLGLSDEILNYRDLEFHLNDDDILRSIREAKTRRMIVSILPKDSDKDHDDIIGRYEYSHGDWKIVMGLPHVDRNPLYYDLAQLTGAGNGFVIGEGPGNTDGQYALTGPGAGPRPTVNTMLNDRLRMLRARRPLKTSAPVQHRDWVVGSPTRPITNRRRQHGQAPIDPFTKVNPVD